MSTPKIREQMARCIDDCALRSGSQALQGRCESGSEAARGSEGCPLDAPLRPRRSSGAAPGICSPTLPAPLTVRVWLSDVTVDPCSDSECLRRESPEAYAACCEKGFAQRGKEPGIASTSLPAQAETMHLDEQQKDVEECPEEAGRTRQAKMAGVLHRLYDLRLVLLRGLDSEPLEVLDDVLRLLEEATDAPATANTSEKPV